MKNENVPMVSSSGISFAGLLTIAFIVLKLVGIINWSWIWILSPLWISAGLGLLILIPIIIILFIKELKKW